eukprot:symbB.v1.2.017756.t1/scaffold1389.1/size122275/5
MEIEFGLLGDSSLYTKRPKKGKNKRYISEEVRWLLPGNAKLEHSCYPGGGVKEFNDYFSKERPAIQIKTLGISYFGNEHTEKPMNQAKHLEMWKTLFRHLRRHVKERVIFFMGGYAAKYGYCQAYDDNMKIIRRWIREIGGFEVRTDFELVENWPLAADNLHFDVACLPALAKYWEKLLVLKIELKEAPCNKRKRCLQEFPEDTLAKKSCRSEDWKQKDAWKDWKKSARNQEWHDSDRTWWKARCNPGWHKDEISSSDSAEIARWKNWDWWRGNHWSSSAWKPWWA